MSAHVPAWKRIGLKVKEELEHDPLVISTHLETANVTNKELKRINKQKRKLDESNKEKKEPKRPKLPKSERAPPPEKDQLAYLKQYHNDRDNWKFSKQKQNWILKNIKTIPGEYEDALKSYLEGLQGGSRGRVVEDLKEVIQKWNKLAQEVEDKLERELNGVQEPTKEDTKEEDTESDKKAKKKAKEEPKEEEVDIDYAERCKGLLEVLTGEVFTLKGLEDDVDEKKEEEVAVENEEAQENATVEDKQESPADESSKKVKNSKKEKKSKKDKKEKSNLILEEVDVSQFDKSAKKKKSKK
ncbi:uncharacterized protein CANTADRAFT_25668 [Suhomyces tanzawaensis NRRL Y-17324]|uniref:WKF domain-containing protein n=1 Tax=Suhomyces tanzawaensis NRRL Y-17324 TaxID=984487 RepID=A0A1E4SK14_9ASCO|nr:uncharacterized protein CANTADRAFT_25668 [Suhomyces tanzawaensis NRRL Y-17324]ODV79843.1 hypothetical protein CANTADRAFT_25668 [Suhomyces tanzawaensis NRRL Y-17324]